MYPFVPVKKASVPVEKWRHDTVVPSVPAVPVKKNMCVLEKKNFFFFRVAVHEKKK